MAKSGKPSPKSDTPKAFDVFRPGKTRASPTSRPVIVGHKSNVQDTTITDKPSQIVGEPEYHHMLDSHDKVDVAEPSSTETAAAGLDNDTSNQPTAETGADGSSHAEIGVSTGELSVTTPEGTKDPVVAFHKTSKSQQLFKYIGVVSVIIVIVIVADVVLDAGIWKPTYNIPHTHLIGSQPPKPAQE